MIKSELVHSVGRKFTNLPEKVIDLCVTEIVNTMKEALSKGKRIEIRGFGCYELRYRASRKAHNPKTGEKIVTLPKYKLHFKPGKELRERVNSGI